MPDKEFSPELPADFDAFDVQRATMPVGGVGLFVITLRQQYSPVNVARTRDAWAAAWKNAGAPVPPTCLIVDDSVSIQALGDAELANVGLMRIPTT